jgi:hypothetical protein
MQGDLTLGCRQEGGAMSMRGRRIAGWGPAAVLVAVLAVLAGCSGNSGGGSASEEGEPLKATGGWVGSRMFFSVGSGMKVSITGGGGGRSNCTRDETVTSFTTAGDNEGHDFGFYAKSDGICALERSHSYFKVVVNDPTDKTVGSVDVFFGQNKVDSYFVRCDSVDRVKCTAGGGVAISLSK